jgi:hypothetical protein
MNSVTEIPQIPHKKNQCNLCHVICSKKNDFQRHLQTQKHLANAANALGDAFSAHKKYACEFCDKNYKSRNGLWKHNKTCTTPATFLNTVDVKSKTTADVDVTDVNTLTLLVMEIVKSNTELQKQCSELQKQMCNTSNITTINNTNSHNKTFNLQVFLNEECKDAMNLSDFVDSFQLQFADLESVGNLGYVEGMSKIIIQKLNEMDVHKRPIHCSDAKRDILHIKANNKWKRETPDYSHLKGAIKCISKKNIDVLFYWKDKHPNVQHAHNQHNDQYLVMIKEVMGGSGEINDSERKIIKNIAKQVMVTSFKYCTFT